MASENPATASESPAASEIEGADTQILEETDPLLKETPATAKEAPTASPALAPAEAPTPTKSRPADRARSNTAPSSQDRLAADTAYNAAIGLTDAGEFAMARDGWLEFLEKFPTNSQRTHAEYFLGVCLFRLQDFDGAVARFQTAFNDPKFPDRDEAMYFHALTLFEKGRLQLGREISSPKKDVANTIAERREEVLPETKKIYDEAIALFRQLISQFPKSKYRENAYYYCGLCMQQLGKDVDAMTYLKVAVANQKFPMRNRALYAMAEVYLNERNPQSAQALELLDTLLKGKPDTVLRLRALRLRADVLYQMKPCPAPLPQANRTPSRRRGA